LLTVQWVYALGSPFEKAIIWTAFHSACVDGHLSTAQWLYSLGAIDDVGAIHDGGRYGFHSHSGDLTVRPDGDLSAIVSVSTFSGDMESDWPMTINPGGGRVHPREWEFTIGGGSARMNLESFSGTIYLRRGGAASRRGDR